MPAALKRSTLAFRRHDAFIENPRLPVDSGPFPLSSHWTEFLWDLACLDPLWVATEIPGISLSQSVQLQGIRVTDGIGLAEGAS